MTTTIPLFHEYLWFFLPDFVISCGSIQSKEQLPKSIQDLKNNNNRQIENIDNIFLENIDNIFLENSFKNMSTRGSYYALTLRVITRYDLLKRVLKRVTNVNLILYNGIEMMEREVLQIKFLLIKELDAL